jgi:HK97 family phage major capsid protein
VTLTNRSLIEKADLALQDLVTGGGYLQPEQSMKFMRLLVKQSKLLAMTTVRPMKAPKAQVSQVKFGTRVLRPGQENVALTLAQRSKPDFKKVELDAELFKAEVHLTDEVLEDNIEAGDFRQTVMELLTDAIARDMEELVINGDTASVDPFLATLDGILKQSTSNVVDANGAALSKDFLDDLLRVLPSEYRNDKTALRFLCAVDSEQDYRSTLAERATAAGDRFLEESPPVMYSGVPLAPIPLWPETQGPNNNRTSIVLTHPKNIVVGIWRQVKIETDRDISAGHLKIVATLRFDTKYVEEPGTAKLIGLASA